MFSKARLGAVAIFVGLVVVAGFMAEEASLPVRKRPIRITREAALQNVLARPVDQLSDDDWALVEVSLSGETASKVAPIFDQILRKGPSARFGDALVRISMLARTDRRAGRASSATNFVPALIEAYRISNSEARGKIADTIGEIGPFAAPAVSLLTATLQNPAETNAFAYVAQALGRIGKPASDAVPTLRMFTNSPWNGLAFHSADALARIADDPAPYLPLVIRHAEPAGYGVNMLAVDALETFATVGPAATNALPVIIRHLEKPSILLTIEPAIKAAAALGSLAESAAPALERIVMNAKLGVEIRTNAVAALGKIKGAAYDVQAGLLAATAEWRRLHEAELKSIEPFAGKLPRVTRIEISSLAPGSFSDSPKIKAIGRFPDGDASGVPVLERTTIEGVEAETLAVLWRKMEFGSWFQAACFQPVYGLRFMDGDKLVLETSVCWECATIRLNGEFEGFNADSADAQKMLETLDKLIPYWTEDDFGAGD